MLRRDVPGLERRRHQPVHRCDCQEPAVAARRQRVPGVLGQEERTRQEHAEERVPPILGEVRDRCDVLEAGARDDRVEPAAEPLQRRVDNCAVPLARREVAVGEVDAVDTPAVRAEALGDRPADPTGRAGDESGLHRRKRKTSSATQTGFSPPSRSTVAAIRAWTPASTSSTSSTRKLARSRLPTGTGAGKRTRFTP
jgi:hypothetical protein